MFLALTSCSASAQIKPDPPIKEQLCTLPPEPVFDRIDETDPENVKLRKLLNNIVKLKNYAEKLKAVIQCLNSAAATQAGITTAANNAGGFQCL